MSKKTHTARNLIALPKPRRAKTVFMILLVVGLVLVIRDPLGAAHSVNHLVTQLQTFGASTGGGSR